jgi:hypothetical protein
MIALQLTGWLTLILINVYVDWRLIKSGKGVNHKAETIVRIGVGILYAWLVFQVRAADEHFQWVALFEITSFWILFELFLNLARGLKPLYLGETAKSDRWFKKNFPVYIGLKGFALALFLVSLIQLLKGN